MHPVRPKQCVKAENRRPLKPLEIPEAPWEEISMDLIVGLPKTKEGYETIVTAVCRLTKMAHFIPTTVNITAEGLAQLMIRELLRLHGVPKAIVSDHDPRFTSELWKKFCRALDTKQKMSTAYHPQTDGQSERTNQTIEQMIRCALMGDETRWADVLPILVYAYNSMQQSSTKAAPFDLSYGFIPPKPICQRLGVPTIPGGTALPFQATIKLQAAKRQLETAQRNQKHYAGRTRRQVNYHTGQQLWLKAALLPDEGNSKALGERYKGPFTITEMIGENAARLDLPPSMLVHPPCSMSPC